MAIFGTKEKKPVASIFIPEIDRSTGPKGLLGSQFAREQAEILYPKVANVNPDEAIALLDAGVTATLQAKAEAVTAQKNFDIYNEVIEVTALNEKSTEDAISELETLRNDNPVLKAFVSPSLIESLKQSESPTARRVAQGKLSNILIASEIINNKMSEAGEGWLAGGADLVDMIMSELPVVSAANVSRRKELGDRFVAILDSNESQEVVKSQLQEVVDEAADMGFFTDANKFFLGDFLALAMEEGEGDELSLQRAFAAADILLWGALSDSAKILGITRGAKSANEASEALMKGVLKDNPAGAVDPSTWTESMITPGRIAQRTPEESTAAQLVEIELRARQEAIDVRIAAGSSIDDETFELVQKAEVEKAKTRAEKAGNLRFIDSQVKLRKDELDNLYLDEFYGTSKGKAFIGKNGLIAAQKYADQILGEVVPVTGQPNNWMVKKTSNVKTGWFDQSLKPNEIADELRAFTPLDTDDLGEGFWAKHGSGHAQTDASSKALSLQGEAARAMALDIIGADLERTIKLVGKEGKAAVKRVYMEMRDGSLAQLREAPTVEAFADYFLRINGRIATSDELRLHSQLLQWNNTDWLFSADQHFKRAVERGIEVILPQEGIEAAATETTKAAQTGRLVWDIDSGKYVKAEDLSEDRLIYRLVEPMDFGGKQNDLVASAAMKKRALKHTDVMGYNVGGSRLYAPNRTNHMIKQETEYTMADGTKRVGVPRTLMATKTEKEALKAKAEINEILTNLHRIADPKAFTKAEDYLNVIKTKYKDSGLNDLIARNSGWNTDVYSVETLVEFAAENNFDLRRLVERVGDREPLINGDNVVGDLTFKDVAVSPGPLKMGDFRKDTVLMGYGGQKLPTIEPFEAIQRSVMSSVARQTEMAYETRAIMRLYRTVLEKGLISNDNIALIRNMSLRQKAENMKILTSSSEGRKLELERKKILLRLGKQRMFDDAYHKAKNNLANVLWDKGWRKASEKIDSLSADPVAGVRGIVFDAYLGLGAIDQFYVQASQMINIVAMSDKALGAQAAAVAPYFRMTIRNGHKAPTEAMAKLSSGALGITPEQFLTMIDTFKKSGRGYVNASVADLGEDSGGKVFLNKARRLGRMPYTEGELMARITAHLAASMEYIKKFGPEADLNKQHATRWVMNQSDILTNAMTSTSRHPIEQLPMMQFMSYSMRMAEWYTSGLLGGKGVLSTKQKARLFTFQLGMYGAAAIPGLGLYLDSYNRNHGTSLNESDFYQIRYGLIDNLFRYVTGVETELGRRLGWGEGLFQTIMDLQDKPIGEALLGPSASVGGNIIDAIVKMQNNLKYGGTSFLLEDTVDVFRTIKSVNMAHNAYYAFKDGILRSRKGDVLLDDVSTGEAIATALGVPLHRVNELWRQAELSRKDQDWYGARAREVNTLYSDWHNERLTNGIGTKRERVIVGAIEKFYQLNAPYMSDIKRYVDSKFITMNEELTIEMMEREFKKEAEKNGL